MKRCVFVIFACTLLLTGCGGQSWEQGMPETMTGDTVQEEIPQSDEILLETVETENPVTDFAGFIDNARDISDDVRFAKMEETAFERTLTDAGRELTVTYETSGIEQPMGVLFLGEQVLVCDGGKSEIAILNREGERVGTLGKLGNGEGEFLNPTDIGQFDDKVYVLDTGNQRVQIFDGQLTYLSQIRFELEEKMVNMEIDKTGNLYLTAEPIQHVDSFVYYANVGQGTLTPVKGLFASRLGGDSGYVYAVSSYNIYADIKEDNYGTHYNKVICADGDTYLYTLENGEIQEVKNIGYACNVMDFAFFNEEIYTVGYKYLTGVSFAVDRFQFPNMQYEETYAISGNDSNWAGYMDIDADGSMAVSAYDPHTMSMEEDGEPYITRTVTLLLKDEKGMP